MSTKISKNNKDLAKIYRLSRNTWKLNPVTRIKPNKNKQVKPFIYSKYNTD